MLTFVSGPGDVDNVGHVRRQLGKERYSHGVAHPQTYLANRFRRLQPTQPRHSNPDILTIRRVRGTSVPLAPAVSASQLPQSGTLSLQLPECVPPLRPGSTVTSRPTISSRPFNPLSAFPFAPQIRLRLTTVRVYKSYLLTYLLT